MGVMPGPIINEVLLILTRNSACMTPILRTYYTWRTVEMLDTSWELFLMGLWTWAELSIGLIVGCLPAIPKLFQHIGPKISRGSSGTRSGRESSAATNMPKADVLARVKISIAKDGAESSVSDPWNDRHRPRAQLCEEYYINWEIDAHRYHKLKFLKH